MLWIQNSHLFKKNTFSTELYMLLEHHVKQHNIDLQWRCRPVAVADFILTIANFIRNLPDSPISGEVRRSQRPMCSSLQICFRALPLSDVPTIAPPLSAIYMHTHRVSPLHAIWHRANINVVHAKRPQVTMPNRDKSWRRLRTHAHVLN